MNLHAPQLFLGVTMYNMGSTLILNMYVFPYIGHPLLRVRLTVHFSLLEPYF